MCDWRMGVTATRQHDSTPEPLESTPEQQPRFSRERAKPPETPYLHPDLVPRTALLERLRAQQTVPVVTIFAPAGYGKSTLLAQVAKSDERPVSLISLEEGDNDPVVLAAHLAEGLDRIAGVAPARSEHFQ